jgi:hypothetical protein
MSNEAEKLPNRSSAPTPAEIGAQNVAMAAAVREAVAGVFAQLAPFLKDMAITPEKLREGMRPYEDPAKVARALREGERTRQEQAQIDASTKAARENCPHLDNNGRSSIQLVHNFPDRQTRGICAHCHDYIHPKEWRMGAPTATEPRGRAYLAEPHKNYITVKQLEAQLG